MLSSCYVTAPLLSRIIECRINGDSRRMTRNIETSFSWKTPLAHDMNAPSEQSLSRTKVGNESPRYIDWIDIQTEVSVSYRVVDGFRKHRTSCKVIVRLFISSVNSTVDPSLLIMSFLLFQSRNSLAASTTHTALLASIIL